MIIDQDNADVKTTGNNQGSNNSRYSVLTTTGWRGSPWESQAGTNFGPASWNPYASPWAVDIKSSRKIEELGQTLWLFHNSPPTVGLSWNLSIGLKLPDCPQRYIPLSPARSYNHGDEGYVPLVTLVDNV